MSKSKKPPKNHLYFHWQLAPQTRTVVDTVSFWGFSLQTSSVGWRHALKAMHGNDHSSSPPRNGER
ncbi:hypothetical protein F441_10917 [Phytophthora nicotianae CJ01A1]|uniref:Uncharacterized protein n=5 Tax=Phytophthora nicotianae TaxID=4792 RepID=V9EYF6_PHYNI|nr:hypothetical protein F443_10995 [Phytophthora nicotianae P1569]ETL90892.1 hypothetical protein L917_10511 [Phytophthora nicotianae]ETO72951.1 hypothetical protein F444_11065 [Phytophthora nicotianae P1976]ETP14114.1 hypothetical protein F441_10917 [Phytophthora nicotianae CJ01A1]ETP42183.1 hypothetical protein F442_10889 [Phytophthora nicotianae P10297]